MKNRILNISLVTMLALLVTTSSCKKTFLDENRETQRDLAFYKTDAGILQLASGAYHHSFRTAALNMK